MKRYLLSVALGLCAVGAWANDDALIHHRYDEQAAAINADNINRFYATLDSSFTQVDEKGNSVNYGQYKKSIAPLFAAVKSATLKFTLPSIKYANGRAVVNYTLIGDLNLGNGRKVHDVEQGVDTWKKVGSTYLLIHEVVKSSKLTPVGGKKPAAMGAEV